MSDRRAVRSRFWRVAVVLWAVIAALMSCLASVWVWAATIRQHSVGKPSSVCSCAIQLFMVHQAMPSRGAPALQRTSARTRQECWASIKVAPADSGGGSSGYSQELKFVVCIRSHGVPNLPDPSPNGAVPGGPYSSGLQWGEPMAASGEKPTAIDTTAPIGDPSARLGPRPRRSPGNARKHELSRE